MRRLLAALALLGLFACPGGPAGGGQASAQEIRFIPPDPQPFFGVMTDLDWTQLFAVPLQWPAAFSRISTFGVINRTNDKPALAPMVRFIQDFMHAGGKQFEISIGAVPPGADGCGAGVEGYIPAARVAKIVANLKAAGVVPDRVSIDNPIHYGTWTKPLHRHDHTRMPCGYTVAQLAPLVAANVTVMKAAWPNVKVDEIDSIGSADTAGKLVEYLADAKLAGYVPDAIVSDTQWTEPGEMTTLAASAAVLRANGIQFGVIADPDPNPTDDAQAVAEVQNHVAMVRAAGIWPDVWFVMSWVDHPSHSLPETDPTSFTGLIDWLAGQAP